MNRMKKEAMKVIAAGMPAEEIAGLEAIFKVCRPLHTRYQMYFGDARVGLLAGVVHMGLKLYRGPGGNKWKERVGC